MGPLIAQVMSYEEAGAGADESDCDRLTRHRERSSVLARFRATGQLGAAKLPERALGFAANLGLGFDVMRVERACRPSLMGGGMLEEKPVLRTSFGPWIDGTLISTAPARVRGGFHFAYGRRDVGWLKLPEWELFAIVGLVRAEHTGSSFSLGARLVFLHAEVRVESVPREGLAWMLFAGGHYDVGAW